MEREFGVSAKTSPAQLKKLPMRAHVYVSGRLPPKAWDLLRTAMQEREAVALRFFDDDGDDSTTYPDLAFLEDLGSLRSLALALRAVKSLDALAELRGLEEISLSGLRNGPALDFLRSLPKVRAVGIDFPAKTLAPVFELPALSQLQLSGGKLEPHVPLLKQLTTFIVFTRAEYLRVIDRAPALRYFSACRVRGLSEDQLAVLGKHRGLETVKLKGLGDVESLEFLDGSPLKNLALGAAQSLESWSGLRGCKGLTYLTTVEGVQIADKSLMPLLKCRNLEAVQLSQAYPAEEIEQFLERYNGKVLRLRGKLLKGTTKQARSHHDVFPH